MPSEAPLSATDSATADQKVLEAFKVLPKLEMETPEEGWPAPVEIDSNQMGDSNVGGRFFSRLHEYTAISNYVKSRPEQPVLILGPRNSGKTAILKEIRNENRLRTLYLNCGKSNVKTPQGMARVLRKAILELPFGIKDDSESLNSLLESIQFYSSPFSDGTSHGNSKAVTLLCEGLGHWFPEEKSEDLNYVIETYSVLLERMNQAGITPIIIIDHIDVLRGWVSLKILLEFFKRTCTEPADHKTNTQGGQAHLLMATSDSSMVSWLSTQSFKGDFPIVEIIGDLTYAEGLRFIRGGVSLDKDGKEEVWPGLISQFDDGMPELRKEDWEKVWGACRGNIHLLRTCVKLAHVCSSWDEAVSTVVKAPFDDVGNALLRPKQILGRDGASDQLWTAADYRTALRLIAESAPYHAVPQMVLEAELGKGSHLAQGVTGDDVLDSMIEYDLLSVRPYSALARDIPRELFFRTIKEENDEMVEFKDALVVMPSPAHLHAALHYLKC